MRLALFTFLFICFSAAGSASEWTVANWNDLSNVWTMGYGVDTGCPSPGMCNSHHYITNQVTNESVGCVMISWHGGACAGDWQMRCGGSLSTTKIYFDFTNSAGPNANCGIE
jgi:hypothetical protein